MYSSLFDASVWLQNRGGIFAHDEDGAVTVDMVVLMAASISLSLAVSNKVSDGIENLATDIGSFMADYEIRTSFDDPRPGDNDPQR